MTTLRVSYKHPVSGNIQPLVFAQNSTHMLSGFKIFNDATLIIHNKFVSRTFFTHFYDKKINFKAKNLRLIWVTIWNLLAVKCSLEIHVNKKGFTLPFRQR